VAHAGVDEAANLVGRAAWPREIGQEVTVGAESPRLVLARERPVAARQAGPPQQARGVLRSRDRHHVDVAAQEQEQAHLGPDLPVGADDGDARSRWARRHGVRGSA
jgi:hypothetical protein